MACQFKHSVDSFHGPFLLFPVAVGHSVYVVTCSGIPYNFKWVRGDRRKHEFVWTDKLRIIAI